jgi:hypothetical protein
MTDDFDCRIILTETIFFLISGNSTSGDLCVISFKIGRRFTSPSTQAFIYIFFFVDVHSENFRRHQGSNPRHRAGR